MKRITVIVLAILIIAASLGFSSGCSTDKASVEEISQALKRCYTFRQFSSETSFDQFTVKDLEVINKTKGEWGTTWSVRAKLYDPNGRYVQDISGNIQKTSLGWMCR